jgi:hypothetical protein
VHRACEPRRRQSPGDSKPGTKATFRSAAARRYFDRVLIAEDLLLLLADEAGTLGERSRLSLGLAGALVLELTLSGRVDLAVEPPPERLVAVDTSPTGTTCSTRRWR